MKKINIFVSFKIPKEWQRMLINSFPYNYKLYFCYDIIKREEIDCIILSPLSENITKDLSKFSKLSMVHIFGVGTDNLLIKHLKERKIKIYLLKNLHENLIAEYVLTNILLWEKNIPLFNSYVHSGKWKREEVRKIISKMPIKLISEKILLIIGLGKSGVALAKLAKRNNIKIIGVIKDKKNKYNFKYFDEIVYFKDRYKVLKKVDYISFNVTLNETTKGMVNKKFLSKMKQDAVIINTSRGEIIIEEDLVKALNKKIIRGASLDVFIKEPLPKNHPFLKIKNIILTPHISGSSQIEKVIKNISYNIQNHFIKIQRR